MSYRAIYTYAWDIVEHAIQRSVRLSCHQLLRDHSELLGDIACRRGKFATDRGFLRQKSAIAVRLHRDGSSIDSLGVYRTVYIVIRRRARGRSEGKKHYAQRPAGG